MLIFRGFRYKLQPTPEQEALFRQFAGACRFVYNLALEQRTRYRDTYEYAGIRLNYIQQARELTDLRSGVEWLAEAPRTSLEQALRDLETAFQRFFSKRSGYPTPRRKGTHDSFYFKGREVECRRLNRKWSAVRLPKAGWVKFRDTRPMRGTLRSATISLDALGWHVSFACAVDQDIAETEMPMVGVDRGVANTLMLSTGEAFCVPTRLEAIERRHRASQRILSRRQKGSARRQKALRRCARLAARRARIRHNWHHMTSRYLASRFGTIVMEDLHIADMTTRAKGTGSSRKSGLNRSILNQGWGNFAAMLGYKLEERGGTLVMVDPAYTSQTCSECGTVDKRSRKSQAVFHCLHCGFRANADHNAAINILRRNTASMGVEEGRWLSDEAPTGSGFVAVKNRLAEPVEDVDLYAAAARSQTTRTTPLPSPDRPRTPPLPRGTWQ